MEFKGTRGKWVSNYSNGSWLIQDLETYQEGFKGCLAEVYYFDDGKDTAEYNALLISKAPEMLEMLKECKRVLSSVQSPATPSLLLYREIEQLIKEATEL